MPAEILPLLSERTSPYAFSSEPLAPGDRDALFEALRWAPSAFNEQPWRLIYGDLHDSPAAHDRVAGTLVPANRAWAESAPLLIVTLASTSYARNGRTNAHAWHDLGLAIGMLTVEAAARGLVVHQMAGIDRKLARVELNVPDGFDIVTGVAIGRPGELADLPEALATRQQAPRVRRPVDETAFVGQFPD